MTRIGLPLLSVQQRLFARVFKREMLPFFEEALVRERQAKAKLKIGGVRNRGLRGKGSGCPFDLHTHGFRCGSRLEVIRQARE